MGQKNFWRRKKNVVGWVAYLHQPLHALDTWGLKKSGDMSVYTFLHTKEASASSSGFTAMRLSFPVYSSTKKWG